MCPLGVACLNALPLSAEPVALWSATSDLFAFLADLYDDSGEVIDDSGRHFPVNYRSYGETLYDQGRLSFQNLAADFQSLAKSHKVEPIPHGPIQIDQPSDFLRDPSFGLMAKHAIAWDAVVVALLSDSLFFSLPHILEAREELDCSVLLAKNLYYKQALQVLRGLLELNVLHVYFVHDQAAYAEWQNANYRVPKLRGPGGLLQKLQERGAIAVDISKAVADLYEALNGTIHSTEARMLNRGIRDRQWAGMQFKAEEFREWCAYVSRIVTVCVKLLAAMLQEIQRQPRPQGIVCSTCRAVNQFTVEDRSSFSVSLRCLRCGSQSSFSPEYAARYGF